MKKKSSFKSFIISFVTLSCALSLFFFIQRHNTDLFIHKISKEEKQVLEPFLKDLVFNNHFGYVLIGEKPISIASYFSQEPFTNLIFYRKTHTFNFEKAWKVFEKYKSELNSRNFLFFIEKSHLPFKDELVENRDIYTIIIINKKVFLSTVEKHLDLFKKSIGDGVTPISLLHQISNAKMGLFEALGCDEGLYGILLGYGRTNALAFKRNLELTRIFDPYFREIISPFTLRSIKPSSLFHSLEEEYASSQKKISFFDLRFPLSPFAPPSFKVINDDDETSDLKQKYRNAHRQLLKMYSGKDFFQITLRQFLNS